MVNLHSLRRLAKCPVPFVGISREGMPPLVLKRTILKGVIEALEEASEEQLRAGQTPQVRVEVNGFLDIRSATRSYKLFNVTETNSECDIHHVCRALESWAKGHREKTSKPKSKRKGPSWLVNQIKAAETRLKYGWGRRAERTFFSWLHPHEATWGYVGGQFREMNAEEARAERARRATAYLRQRQARVDLGRIAGRFLRLKLEMGKVYEEVRALGHQLEPLSRQPKHVRDKGAEEFVKHLFRHVGLMAKPDELKAWAPTGSDACRRYTDRLNGYRQAQARIDVLRDLLTRYERGEDVVFDAVFEEECA